MWWSLNQVLPLRGFERLYHASGVVLAYAFFLSLMGLVVFSVLISLINNTMLGRIEALRRGETPVLERDHVLVEQQGVLGVASACAAGAGHQGGDPRAA